MISITPVTGSPLAAIGPAVPCLFPEELVKALAGPLDDVPDYHPAYYTEPLPLPPRVRRHEPALGRITWPCWGLTRFAVGHVLLSGASLAAIESAAGYLGQVWVTFTDGTNTNTLTMRIVNRRPLADPRTALSLTVDQTPMAWVVSLVDIRWDISGLIYASATPGTPATWGDLLSEVLAAANYSISATAINTTLAIYTPPYDAPNSTWFSRSALTGRPAAVLADAIAAACGLRISVGPDGTIYVQGPDDAATGWSTWLASYKSSLSGGLVDNAKTKPKTIDIYSYGGTAAITRTLTGGIRGDLLVCAQSSISSNCANRIAADIGRWLGPGTGDMRVLGYPPAPGSSLVTEYGWDTSKGESWISDGPTWYPWPLAGYVPSAGGPTVYETYSGITTTSFATDATASFPSGYAVRSMGGTTLSITDTVRVYFPKASAAGQLAATVILCSFNLFVGTISGGTAGFFVVKANGQDLASGRYDGTNPFYLAATAPATVLYQVVTATQNYTDISVTYTATFYSDVAWGGSGQPTTKFRACSAAIAFFNNDPTDWLTRSTRGSGGVAACPTTVSATSA